jgi:hypothetical protein
MLRLFLVLIGVLASQVSLAGVYKCERDGKVEYQGSPCVHSHDVTGKKPQQPDSLAAAPDRTAVGTEKKCTGDRVSINFTNMPLREMLWVLGDIGGKKVTLAPSVGGSGAFRYDCVPWNEIVRDVAARHRLDVKIQGAGMSVSNR